MATLENKAKRKVHMIKTKTTGILLLFTFLLAACHSADKLEPGGAYAPANITTSTNAETGVISTNVIATAAPDLTLFQVDSGFQLAYTTVNAIFELERNNRALLWSIDPKIKRTLDQLRPQAVKAVQQYGAFRQAYIENPTPAGLTQLQTVLADIQRFSAAAQIALPKK